MSYMNYFRRPELTGKNMSRTASATIRGSVRRLDADVVSAVPYFPAAVGPFPAVGGLTLTVNTVPKSVTITSNSFKTILDDINSAIGPQGIAFDADGTIGLRTLLSNGTSSIEVTGGSLAAALGFDVSLKRIRAIGGDLASTPEARNENPFGSAFPAHGENLTTETLTRSLGRIAANTDVLHADLVRGGAVLKKTSFTIDPSREFITPPASTRIFTGGPSASNASSPLKLGASKELLSSYFFLYDTVAKAPAPSRVIAVVRGSPSGTSYLSNAPNWNDTTGKNVLGLNLLKVGPSSITSISEGRFVKCDSATFITSGVVAGDVAWIDSNTNRSPWDNNGFRWVVQTVLSETQLELRPLSKSELDQISAIVPREDTQPILELNGEGLPGTFGNLIIGTGIATSGVNLVCDPPLLPGASYELWAAVPLSFREERTWEDLNNHFPASLYINSDLDTVPNGVLSRPTVSLTGGGTTYSYTSFYARWHGKVIYIPAGSVPRTVGTGTREYIYWDEATAHVMTSTGASFNGASTPSPATSASSTQGHLLYTFYDPSASPTLSKSARLQADNSRASLTVGHGGQFSDLQEAVAYADSLRRSNSESSAEGPYSHFEIVVVSDQDVSQTIEVPDGIRIRGATPQINLQFIGGSSQSIFSALGKIELIDLTIGSDAADTDVISCAASTPEYLRVSGLTSGSGTGNLRLLCSISGDVDTVEIENCNLECTSGLIHGTVNLQIGVTSSKFSRLSGTGNPVSVFNNSAGTGISPVDGRVQGCVFSNLTATSAILPIVLKVGSASSAWVFDDCKFKFDTIPDGGSILIDAGSGDLIFQNSVVESSAANATVGQAILGSGTITVSNSEIAVQPINFGYGVQATHALGNTVTGVDSPVSGRVNNVALQVKSSGQSNTVSGVFRTGIEVPSSSVSVHGNRVSLTPGANTGFPDRGINLLGSFCFVSNNVVQVVSGKAIQATSGTTTGNVLQSNYLLSNTGPIAVQTASATAYTLANNTIYQGSFGASSTVECDSANKFIITGNIISSRVGVASVGVNLTSVGLSSVAVTLSDNVITTNRPISDPNNKVSFVASNNVLTGEILENLSGSFSSNTVTGNVGFTKTTSVVGNTFAPSSGDPTCVVKFELSANDVGNFSDNNLLSSTQLQISGDPTSSFVISDNFIDYGVAVISGASLGDVNFSGNRVNGSVSLSPTSGDKTASISGNTTGSLTVGGSIKHAVISGCEVLGALVRNAPVSGGSSRIGDTHTTSTALVEGNTSSISNCCFDSYAQVCAGISSATDAGAVISSCVFKNALQVEGRVSVTGSSIATDISPFPGSVIVGNEVSISNSCVRGLLILNSLESFNASESHFSNSVSISQSSSGKIAKLIGCSADSVSSQMTHLFIESCSVSNGISNDAGSPTTTGSLQIIGSSCGYVLSNCQRCVIDSSSLAGAVSYDLKSQEVLISDSTFANGVYLQPSADGAVCRISGSKIQGNITDSASHFAIFSITNSDVSSNLSVRSNTFGSMTASEITVGGYVNSEQFLYSFISNSKIIGACTITGGGVANVASVVAASILSSSGTETRVSGCKVSGSITLSGSGTKGYLSNTTFDYLYVLTDPGEFFVDGCTGRSIQAAPYRVKNAVISNCYLEAGSQSDVIIPCILLTGSPDQSYPMKISIHGNVLISNNSGNAFSPTSLSPCILLGSKLSATSVNQVFTGVSITGNTIQVIDNVDNTGTGLAACITNTGIYGENGSKVLGFLVSSNLFQPFAALGAHTCGLIKMTHQAGYHPEDFQMTLSGNTGYYVPNPWPTGSTVWVPDYGALTDPTTTGGNSLLKSAITWYVP